MCLGIKGKTGEIVVGDAQGVWRTRTIRRKQEAERWRDTHASMAVGVPWKHGKHDLEQDGEMEPREIEDAMMQDNERLDVDIGESDTETRKKRRITFKERPTHEDEDDFGGSTRAQSAVPNGGCASKAENFWEEDHQEEQQAKKAKNSDEEMDIRKVEDEEDDGYQPNTKSVGHGG